MVFPRRMDRTLLLFRVLRGGAAGTDSAGQPEGSRVGIVLEVGSGLCSILGLASEGREAPGAFSWVLVWMC